MKGLAAALIVAGAIVACSQLPEGSPSCLDTGCGSNGTCSVTSDPPVCACQPGYAGPACAECAPGFQDNDGNGLCARACSSSVTCGPHERCSDVSGRAVCGCVVGYSRTREGGCVFTGGPVDPSFSTPELRAWDTRGQVSIDPGRPADVGGSRGWVRFSGSGKVFQSFEMPAYADAEPLALELDVTCAFEGGCSNARQWFSIAFDDWLADQAFFSRGSFRRARVCLGERAFGRVLGFGLRAYGSSSSWGPREDALLGRAEFVPSADCARPGTVRNGDFEAGDWDTDAVGSGFLVGSVVFVEANGGRSARLTQRCDNTEERAAMSTSMSVPEALEHPALAFSLEGTRDGVTLVDVDGAPVAEVRGTGAKEEAVVCLPRTTPGLALRLGVAARLECPSANILRLDDFVLRSEPSCGALESVSDGGFEHDGMVSPWQSTSRRVRVVRDPADAHSGNAFLRIDSPCGDDGVRAAWSSSMLHVPSRPPNAAGGAALKLWYRLRTDALAFVTAGEVGAEGGQRLPRAAEWTEAVLCLPSESWGRQTSVAIDVAPVRRPDDLCQSARFDLDDLSIAPDPSCPID
ncbi:MAG: hypothetical protein KF764_04590 [Labilithrix sp.]|nr:hypothetical protein [Labilithrix sp.]